MGWQNDMTEGYGENPLSTNGLINTLFFIISILKLLLRNDKENRGYFQIASEQAPQVRF